MDHIKQLRAEAPARIRAASSLDALQELERELIGRSSIIAQQRKNLGSIPPEERPAVGAALNEAYQELKTQLETRRAELERAAEDELLEVERTDVTLPVFEIQRGHHHLLTETVEEVCDIFTALGYAVATGPEVETAAYNFDALNTPPTHPARLESDTLYVDWGDPADELLLRTQTSPMQVRYMEQHEPPVYVIVPGRVYRSDALDATHSPVFTQIEGLSVDDALTFADLKGTLQYFMERFFGAGRKIRMYPHFFPFTEPSAEMAVSCFNCDGSGCRVCGQTGWIELLGCGMVDPNVFDAVGYDPTRVSGFAFGVGVERLAMVRHGIGHIRHFFDNDVRVLEQFR
ncbi:MAG: phenylalanine--tRNA ligase subunit alpha [Gammaproteobacteria bacterium]|nr:phenylalanine--tRNA ligase subunit alpha [Gammaproteobacteria bacterium]